MNKLIVLMCLLSISCLRTRVVAYSGSASTIKVCSHAFANFDDVEDDIQSICKDNYEILGCSRVVNGYIDSTPIRIPCCSVSCPYYKNRRTNKNTIN